MSANPPSARYVPGNPRPIGFQDVASSAHIDRASEALEGLVNEVNGRPDGGVESLKELAVCLCNVRFVPGSPFQLFGFHILSVRDGEFIDQREAGEEIRFAIVVNHPAEVQVESALAFLFQLIGRDRTVSAARKSGDLSDLDVQADDADSRADREFLDSMRFGWQEAAAAVARKAGEAGYRLRLRYQRDPLPQREELVERMPMFRELYDEVESIRRAVDNTVSTIGGSYPHMRFAGAPSVLRDTLQGNLVVFALRQFQNQTTRDAEVCGNGYLLFSEGADISPRCLAPESVEIGADGEYFEITDMGRKSLPRLLQLRGLDQIDSPYGISPFESTLYSLSNFRTFRQSADFATELIETGQATPDQLQWARQTMALSERVLSSTEERVSSLIGFHRDHLPEAKPDLYFPGQERFR
jgi:hypothetical protein